ncbi:hypothetical protein EW146_g10041 [Bondarzewia mesenterica]|uniref:DUF6534 domain-containing protein n=1 Tax=Bondarzewia mesenterica TaxID=1095465 RepID=A0A4S4L152_9AGAM|nr:hypothetical protein EW146_g10041 [Bondarzewia mesenterica]
MAPPSESVNEVVRTKFGPMLLGVIVSAILYGVTFLQTIYYFDHYPKDTIVLKVTVAALWIIDTLIMALDCHAVYYFSILRFGDVSVFGSQTWSLDSTLCIARSDLPYDAGFRDVYVSIVLCDQDTQIEQGFLPGIEDRGLYILFFVSARCSDVCDQLGYHCTRLLTIVNVVSATALDFLITIILCFILYQHGRGLKGSNMISRLMTFLITRGIITNINQMLLLITYLALTSNLIWVFFHLIMCRIYTNAVLATLNNRSRIWGHSEYISRGSATQDSKTAYSQLSFHTPNLVESAGVEDSTFTPHVGYPSAGELCIRMARPDDHVGTLDLVV